MSGIEPTKIDYQGLKMVSDDDTKTITFTMEGTTKGMILDYDLTTTPKQFSITSAGINWNDGVSNNTTGLQRLALVQEAFQAVELPPNATTLAINDTLLIDDGTNTGSLTITGTDLEVLTSAGDIVLNPTGSHINCSQKSLKQVDTIEGTNNTDITIEAKGTGDFVVETNGVERLRVNDNGSWTIATSTGSSGQVLTSAGAGSTPTWTTIATGSSSIYTNIPADDTLVKKQAFSFASSKTITNSSIVARVDNAPIANPAVYTFGNYIQPQIVGCFDNRSFYSRDGITWTANNSDFYIQQVVFTGTTWVGWGRRISTSQNGFFTSTDGITWTFTASGVFTTCYKLEYNGSVFVGVGDGGNSIAYSTNGTTWTGLSFNYFTAAYDVGWNGTYFLAIGIGSGNVAVYSTDGITWTPTITTGTGLTGLRGVCWDGNRWLIGLNNSVSGIQIWYSYTTLAGSWFNYASPISNTTTLFTNIYDIKFNGKIYCATGEGAFVAYSYDGVSWVNGFNSSTYPFNLYGWRLCWTGKIWLASGASNNGFAWSPNGEKWVVIPPSISGLNTGTGVIVSNWRRPNTITFPVGSTTGTISVSGGSFSTTNLEITTEPYTQNGIRNCYIRID